MMSSSSIKNFYYSAAVSSTSTEHNYNIQTLMIYVYQWDKNSKLTERTAMCNVTLYTKSKN